MPQLDLSGITQYIFPIAILVIFVVLIIVPQRRRDKTIKEMLYNIKVGDNIKTIGGIYGKVVSIKAVSYTHLPLFWESVKKEPGVDGREFDQFVKEMAEQGNIIVDAHGDYRCSFAMSDALISDATTFLGEYNATGRDVYKRQG